MPKEAPNQNQPPLLSPEKRKEFLVSFLRRDEALPATLHNTIMRFSTLADLLQATINNVTLEKIQRKDLKLTLRKYTKKVLVHLTNEGTYTVSYFEDDKRVGIPETNASLRKVAQWLAP